MRKQLMVMVFADIAGFGGLSEAEVVSFTTELLPGCIRLANEHEAVYCNTWGDAIAAYFESVEKATDYALLLRDLFRNREWGSSTDVYFRHPLAVRIAMHAADVFVHEASEVPGGRLFGTQVSLAARIEPIAAHNAVFASEVVVSLLRAHRRSNLQFTDLGVLQLPKEGREERIYWIRRAGETASTLARELIRPPIRSLPTTEAALSEIRQNARKLRSIRVLNLNGGSSLHALLDATINRLSTRATVQILVYDPDCTRLMPPRLQDGSELTYLSTLRNQVLSAPDVARAACEYLAQASELMAWTSEPQQAQQDRVKERLSIFLGLIDRTGVQVTMLKSPKWVLGRCWILDERAYMTFYAQPNRLSPVLVADAGTSMFDALISNFQHVWHEASNQEGSVVFSGASLSKTTAGRGRSKGKS